MKQEEMQKRRKEDRKLVCPFLIVLCALLCKSFGKESLSIEHFTYYTEDSIPIQSVLYLPKGDVKRIVIELFSFDKKLKNPNFIAVLCKIMANLVRND
ncbi:MAG: hypothetical protein IKZ83_02630 [Prevotella sp.]|nr:hypothetical protein [Prevotella sp.]